MKQNVKRVWSIWAVGLPVANQSRRRISHQTCFQMFESVWYEQNRTHYKQKMIAMRVQRHQQIQQFLREHEEHSVPSLATQLRLGDRAIRRDQWPLGSEDRVIRTHGRILPAEILPVGPVSSAFKSLRGIARNREQDAAIGAGNRPRRNHNQDGSAAGIARATSALRACRLNSHDRVNDRLQ